jgi:hypothetical protein
MKVEEETGMSIRRGDIVTFSYESYSRRALPTEARILRVREDTTWEKIVFDYSQQIPKSQVLSGITKRNLERKRGDLVTFRTRVICDGPCPPRRALYEFESAGRHDVGKNSF